MAFQLELAQPYDLNSIYSLFEQRVKWMDEKGIRQWNVTHYLQAYTKDYFLEMIQQKKMYIIKNYSENEIISAVVLKEQDELWSESVSDSAYYIHNLVTSSNYKGIGDECIKLIHDLAILYKKDYIRLDCAVDNQFLNQYYQLKGYNLVGECTEGLYKGNKREFRINR